MRKVVVLMMLLCIGTTYAQQERSLKLNKDKNIIEVVYYHENGEISQTGTYTVEGKLHGQWFSYCEDGNKIVSARYDNGKKVGKWFFWIGDTLKEVDYLDNTIAKINEWQKNTDVIASSGNLDR
jgi:antitoxin component YwqK of YwqJK toxin-antitoxin module